MIMADANTNVARILVVEDHPDQRDLLAMILEREGYRVLTAGDGQEALDQLHVEPIDLVLADILMPRIDGFELVKRIRCGPDFQGVYIILVTARIQEGDRVRGLDLGANDYITKPFSFSELLARVRVGVRVALEHRRLREFKDQALRDTLTGLINRRALETTAEDEFRRTHEARIPLCLLIMDIDDFKRINDEYGHITGDKVLKQIAKIILRAASKGAVCGRYGGEEFCMIMGETTLSVALGQAEKLRRMVEKTTFKTTKSKFSVTTSVGISSTHLKEYSDWKQLFHDADKAMYAAKASGKNCVKVFLPDRIISRAYSAS
jgi:diguanylate cyclase (GGDEF)-like protein